MRTIIRKIASAVIISKDNKILFCKRDPKEGGVYGDSWQIPGGGIDKNETELQTIIREVKEEVGIDLSKTKIDSVVYRYTGESEKTLRETGERVFVKMSFNTHKVIIPKNSSEIKVKLTDEFVEYKWIKIKNLPKVKHNPPSIILFKKLGYL